MSSSVLIGIDLGTSKIVALAVDSTNGEIIARSSRPNEAEATTSEDRLRGRSEWDASQIARVALQCLRDCSEQLGNRRADVMGIGITGQQHGMLLLDHALQPCTPLINWQDRRGLETNERLGQSYVAWARQEIGDEAVRRTGCRLQPGFMALTLSWLRMQNAIPPATSACFIMDYFASCLIGKASATDPTCAASAGVLNVLTRQWDDASIQALGLSVDLFPVVREARERAGELTLEAATQIGLRQGIPVFVPIGDHQASFLGTVRDRNATALLNVGTGAQVAAFTPHLDFKPPLELRPFPFQGNLLSNVGLAGGWSYSVLEDFFRDVGSQLFGVRADPSASRLFESMNRLAESVEAGANGLECAPLFNGTRDHPAARGTLVGISPQNLTAAHLCRAILEGMAANYRKAYEQIQPFVAWEHADFAGSGNGLRSNPVLLAAVQNELKRPIRFPKHREEAAFGAAIVAAVACGVCADVSDAGRFVQYEN